MSVFLHTLSLRAAGFTGTHRHQTAYSLSLGGGGSFKTTLWVSYNTVKQFEE